MLRNWKVILGIMVCFAIMMSSSYTMLIPFLPIYLVEELGASGDNVNIWSGIIFSISFAISAVVSPLWGKLSDHSGKKPMILRASILLSLTYFLGGLVHTPLQLFLVRVLQGIASGLWPACLSLLSAYVPKNRIGIAMGLMQSANITGGIIGPLMGGTLASLFGMRNSFFVGAASLMTITIVTVFFIKEPPKEVHPSADGTALVKSSNMALLKNPNVFILLACAGLTNMVILSLQPIMTLYIRDLDGTDPQNLMLVSGLVFSLGGMAGAMAAPVWGRTGQKVGFYKTMFVAFLAAGIIIALQGLPKSLVPFAIMQFMGGLGFSGIFPSANSILILVTPPTSRGAGFGLFFAAQQVGGAIGPVLGGLIATFMPLHSVFFFSGGILFIIGVYLVFRAPEGIKIQVNETARRDSASTDYIKKLKRKALEEIKREKMEQNSGTKNRVKKQVPPFNKDNLPYI
ncbi:MAG: MFS transporter [Succinivibrio sp.]|nr:MFS transporter [Succinivibrio sp.]